ncbi:DNA alkylation repair protein [Luteolibacter sp. AS25]|uniref:DNA alkylation repair protein n=1 Tax=Luteolibacter sp. AS25 TaxID=3135776 RepID=UPI00398AAFF6
MAPSNKENTAFKNWINRDSAGLLATAVHSVHPSFDRETFLQIALADLEKFELKARVRQFSQALASTLPPSIPEAIEILIRSLPPALPDCETLSCGWHLWPIAQFIEDHGVPHPAESIAALTELTQRFTGEFAIRPFIIAHPEQTLVQLEKLTQHPNPHVRRWCSEGSRPRLPWGKQIPYLVSNPSPLFPILDALKNDPELYVRRSVSNSLNDIAKDHPDLVVKKCASWRSQSTTPETARLIRHALRTLVKNGHPGALTLLGYAPPENISSQLTLDSETVEIGSSLPMTLTLRSSSAEPQKLLIDYAVHYIRKSGQTSPKVFKWKTITLDPGKETSFSKRHSFRLTTIRALYPGGHAIEILINGQSTEIGKFALTPARQN